MKWMLIVTVLALATPIQVSSQPVAYLIQAEGDVSLRRSHSWLPASAGAELGARDTIRLGAHAVARILCTDLLTSWQPLARTESAVLEGCLRTSEVIRIRDGQEALGVRSAELQPWILTPSNTAIADATPLIQWEAVPNSSSYRVSVFDTADRMHPIWGPALVARTSIRYPGIPPLTAGRAYFVHVQTAVGGSADGMPFHLADAEARRGAEACKQQFSQTIPEAPVRQLATALYLLHHDFRSDASALLNELAQTLHSPALQLLRARAFNEIGNDGAEQVALRAAVDEAKTSHDSHTQAAALLAMAKLASKREDAVNWSRQAAQLFRKLGETAQSQKAEQFLQRSLGRP